MLLEDIKYLFRKNSTILKTIQNYCECVPDHQILHVHDIITKHKNTLSAVKLVYSQYKNFDELYVALLKVTNETKSNYWDYANRNGLIVKFKKSNIQYIECKNDIIIAKINTFEQMQEYGSSAWCIQQQKKHFNSYSNVQGRTQYILFDFKNKKSRKFRIGFTYGENYFIAFSEHNGPVHINDINRHLTSQNQFNLHHIDVKLGDYDEAIMLPNYDIVLFFITRISLFIAFSFLVFFVGGYALNAIDNQDVNFIYYEKNFEKYNKYLNIQEYNKLNVQASKIIAAASIYDINKNKSIQSTLIEKNDSYIQNKIFPTLDINNWTKTFQYTQTISDDHWDSLSDILYRSQGSRSLSIAKYLAQETDPILKKWSINTEYNLIYINNINKDVCESGSFIDATDVDKKDIFEYSSGLSGCLYVNGTTISTGNIFFYRF